MFIIIINVCKKINSINKYCTVLKISYICAMHVHCLLKSDESQKLDNLSVIQVFFEVLMKG